MTEGIDPWSIPEEGFPRDGPPAEQAEHLIRLAVLAPSSHNTQPWRFRAGEGRIDLHVDDSRWLRVADADKRELYLSVGCALENLLVAAEHFGFAPRVRYLPRGAESPLAARVELQRSEGTPASPRPPDLFRAIARRHTNRNEYDDRPVPDDVLTDLRGLVAEAGIELHFTDSARIRLRIDDLTARADALQFSDPEWRRELGFWLGKGVFGMNWLMSKVARLAVSHLDLSRSTARKDRELLNSASVLGLVAVDEVSRRTQLRAGQAFQRVFLGATNAGLALQPMNQLLQVPETRQEFEALLPEGWGVPQLTFRLGYAEPVEPTPRRPLEEVTDLVAGVGDGQSAEPSSR